MRSCHIPAGMSLRDCDMFLIMILFCLVVQATTRMCVALIKTHRLDLCFPSFKHWDPCFPQHNDDYDKFPTVALLFIEWFMLENMIFSVWDNQASVTWKWQHVILLHILAASRPWCHYMLIKSHSKWLPLNFWVCGEWIALYCTYIIFLQKGWCIHEIFVNVSSGLKNTSLHTEWWSLNIFILIRRA